MNRFPHEMIKIADGKVGVLVPGMYFFTDQR